MMMSSLLMMIVGLMLLQLSEINKQREVASGSRLDIETIDLFSTLKKDIITTVKNPFQEEMALLKSSLPNIINNNVNTPKTLRLNNSLQMNMTYPKMNVLELFFNWYNENFSLK
jgi:hypothetical protein